MSNFETRGNPEIDPIIEELKMRSANASEKVRKQAEMTIEHMNRIGDAYLSQHWLNGLQGDFSRLVKNSEDPIGQGVYKGWTPEEIKELYKVYYGEELAEDED